MAISPPSDILLDVARAADPTKVQAATARLARLAADPAATNEGFSKAMAAARTDAKAGTTSTATAPSPMSVVHSSAGTPAARGLSAQAGVTPKTDVYQKFETVLLQSFVESMLPKDEELFGDKNSAGIYRSMMAEQFATQISKAGGIGIAKAVAHAHPALPTPKPLA